MSPRLSSPREQNFSCSIKSVMTPLSCAIILPCNIDKIKSNNQYFPRMGIATNCLQCFDTVGWAGGIRKSIWPGKNWVMRCWCSYVWSEVQTVYGPADATASQNPKKTCFTFLVPAYPGCPGKEAVKWLVVGGTEIATTNHNNITL